MISHTRNASVLVWGARGFIGQALVDELIGQGARVRVLSRSLTGPRPPWADAVEWVRLNPESRERSFDEAVDGASIIFNLAGASGAVDSNRFPIESLDANCRLQLEFLEACARAGHGPHVVFSSSRLVYGPGSREPIAETHPVRPASMYAAHKLCVEHYHQIYGHTDRLTFTVCRISNPFGVDRSAPERGYGFINALIQKAMAGQRMTLFGTGRQLRDYIYINDVVAMLQLCAVLPAARNEVLNIGCGRSVSIYDAATQIVQCFGGGPIDLTPWPAEYEVIESGDFVFDISRARTLLAFTPLHSFADGLADVRRQLVARESSRLSTARAGAVPPAALGGAAAIQG